MKKRIIINIFLTLILISGEIKSINNVDEKPTYNFTYVEETVEEVNVVEEYRKKYNNDDIIAEFKIDSINFVTPIAHTTDNEYYLQHDFYKNSTFLGAVFMDYRNNIDDRKILIYGHNSIYYETEFKELSNYLKEDYYNKNKYFTLTTLDDEYHYEVFSVYIARTDYRHVNLKFDDDGYVNHLNWLRDNSIYKSDIEFDSSDKVLVLQTCYMIEDKAYIIISARMIEE